MDISDKELSGLEKTAMEKANRTISAIESAIAAFEGLDTKPEDLGHRIQKLRYYQEELSAWYAAMLKSRGDSAEGRVARLRKLYEICEGWQG